MRPKSEKSPEIFNIRAVLRMGDIADVTRMVQATGAFSAEEIKTAAELVAEALDVQDNPGKADGDEYRCLMAEQGGILAGFSCFGRIPLTQSSYDLYWLVVDPGFQRQGLAACLMRESEIRMKALGAARAFAETSSTARYEPARRFYKSQGFEETARFADFYKPGDAKIVFLKNL